MGHCPVGEDHVEKCSYEHALLHIYLGDGNCNLCQNIGEYLMFNTERSSCPKAEFTHLILVAETEEQELHYFDLLFTGPYYICDFICLCRRVLLS